MGAKLEITDEAKNDSYKAFIFHFFLIFELNFIITYKSIYF